MRATLMYGAGDVRVETVPDAGISEPTDALLRVTRSCICGSDLWPYNQMEHEDEGRRMGHEFIGVVEAVGADVRSVKPGDVVVAPFAYSDGTCVFCHEGLQTSCLHGGFWGREGVDGGQGEAVRVPLADGTLVALPVGADDALMPSLLTLSDVMERATTRRSRPAYSPGRRPRSSATARSGSAVSSPQSASAPSRSSCSAATPPASSSAATSARPTSSASAARKPSSACAS
jgi:threonine dehydrogenase-like Zn-dependent dehydrogenase